MGPSARGVAMVTGEESDGELERLAQGGITGFRFRTLPGGVLPWDKLDRMAARAQEFGWHTDIEMDGRTLPEHEAAIARLPGTLVIDHIGKFLEPVALDHPAVAVLMRLMENGRTYVKIAAPYDSSRSGPPDYADVAPLVAALVRAAPERLMWATNWPHAALGVDQRPDDAAWLDLMRDWMPDDVAARCWSTTGRAARILETNAQAPHRDHRPRHGGDAARQEPGRPEGPRRGRAAFSPSEARRKAFAEKFPFPLADSLDAILADKSIDCVEILTPPNTHLDLVRDCAAAGKHILLEKPLEISTARARRAGRGRRARRASRSA